MQFLQIEIKLVMLLHLTELLIHIIVPSPLDRNSEHKRIMFNVLLSILVGVVMVLWTQINENSVMMEIMLVAMAVAQHVQ